MHKYLEAMGWKKYGKWDPLEISIDIVVCISVGTIGYVIVKVWSLT